MSTFWKPCSRETADRDKGAFFKQLGNGVYELWCRCDLCFRSGQSRNFLFMERGDETGELCEECGGFESTIRELQADGWTFR